MTNTATTPAALVRDAEAALTAARAAEQFLADNPDLPVARIHAYASFATASPVLEIQLDEDLDALTRFANQHGLDIDQGPGALGIVEYHATLIVQGVEITVTAYEHSEHGGPF